MANYKQPVRRQTLASHRKSLAQQRAEAQAKAAALLRKKQEEEKKRQEGDPLLRSISTVGDVLSNVVTGALKGVEGVVDLGIGIVGGVGGLFSEDFREGAESIVEYDASNEWVGKHLQELTKYSYTNNNDVGEIVEGISMGVGQLLPAVAVTVATAGGATPTVAAQMAGLGTTMASAAGNATEEAFKDGADYYRGLAYGAASGAVEGATEKIFGGGTGKLFGKGVADGVVKGVAKQGAARIAKEALEEGVEEVAAEVAAPALKTIYKGTDALREYGEGDYWKSVAEAGIIGAGTSVAYGGSVGRVLNRGGNADIDASLESIRETERAADRLSAKRDLTDSDFNAIRETVKGNLQNVEKVLKKAAPEKRAKLIKNYGFEGAFDSDGSLRADYMAQSGLNASEGLAVAESANGSQEQNSAYLSPSLSLQMGKVSSDLSAITENLQKMDMESGGTGKIADVTLFRGTLSERGRAMLGELKKAVNTLSEKAGGNIKFAIVSPNEHFDAVNIGNTVYIGADVLESGEWAGKLIHEVTHFAEGSKEYAQLMNLLYRDSALLSDAMNTVVNEKNYGFSREAADSLKGKMGGNIVLDKAAEVQYNRKRAKYIPYSTLGEDNVKMIRRQLKQLYQGVESGIADGIAIENGNAVYIVDSGKENGEIAFGVRKKITFQDAEYRKIKLEEINDRAISKGYVSEQLLEKIGRSPNQYSRSDIGRELQGELSLDTGKSEYHQGRISNADADRGGRGLNTEDQQDVTDSALLSDTLDTVVNEKNYGFSREAADSLKGKMGGNVALDKTAEVQYNRKQQDTEESEFPVYKSREELRSVQPIDFQSWKLSRRKAAREFGLTEAQSLAIESYVRCMAYPINQKLITGNISEKNRAYIDELTEALRKFPTFEGRTYRNLQFQSQQQYGTFLLENAQGRTITLKAFTSTSKNPNGYPLSGKYVVHMVFDGVSGRDIADTYGIQRQQEVLFLPGTQYKVDHIATANDHNIIIFVKEVVNDEVQIGTRDFRGERSGSVHNDGPLGRVRQRQGNDDGRVLSDGRGNGNHVQAIHRASHLDQEEILTLEEQALLRETNAHLSEKILGADEAFVERLLRSDETVVEKILNRIDDAKRRLASLQNTDTRKEYNRLRKAEKLYLKAVERAGMTYRQGRIMMRREEKAESLEKAKWSLKIKHSNGYVEELTDARRLTEDQALEYLKQAKAGKLQGHSYIPVRKDTPQVIIDTLKQVNEDVDNRSIVMQVRKVQQAMSTNHAGEKNGRFGNNVRKHGLTAEQVLQLIRNLDKPRAMIYQTNRRDKNGKPLPNNVAVVVDSNDGAEGIAIIEFDSVIDSEFIGKSLGELDYHTIVTVFEPDVERHGVPFDYVEELLSNPNNTELQIQRRQTVRSATREKHPNTSNNLPSNSSISQISEKSTGTPQFSLKNKKTDSIQSAPAFHEYAVSSALYDALDHKDSGDDNLIRVSKMPRYVTENFGIEGDFYIYRDHAYENMVSKEQAQAEGRPVRYGKKEAHFHNLGIDTMTEAILSIENPTMTVKVNHKDGNPTVVMMLPVYGNNSAPLYAVLSFYSDQPINGRFERKPHIVLTVAERDFFGQGGRDGWAEFIRNAIDEKRVLDFNEKKRTDLTVIAQQSGLGNITEGSLKDSIAQFRKEINTFKQKNKISYSLKEKNNSNHSENPSADDWSKINAELKKEIVRKNYDMLYGEEVEKELQKHKTSWQNPLDTKGDLNEERKLSPMRAAALKAEYNGEKVFRKQDIAKALDGIEAFQRLDKFVRERVTDTLCHGYNVRLTAKRYATFSETMYYCLHTMIQQELGYEMYRDEIHKMDEQIVKALNDIVKSGRPSVKANLYKTAQKEAERTYDKERERAQREAEMLEKRAKHWREEYERVSDRAKALPQLARAIGKLADIKKGRYLNASDYLGDTFKVAVNELARMNWRGGLINDTKIREHFASIASWYTKENPLYRGDGEGNVLFRQEIADALQNLGNLQNGALSVDDIRLATHVARYFIHEIEAHGTVWKEGKRVDAKPYSEKHIAGIVNANDITELTGILQRMQRSEFSQLISDPAMLMRLADRYQDGGFFTEQYEQLRQGAINAQVTEAEISQEFQEFWKKNKSYGKHYNHDTVKYGDKDIPVAEAISLYMSMKREHLLAGLGYAGFDIEAKRANVEMSGGFADEIEACKKAIYDSLSNDERLTLTKKDHERIARQALEEATEARRDALYAKLNDTDKELIALMERGYEKCRELKIKIDMILYGYSNVTQGYYYPARRTGLAENVDAYSGFEGDRVSNLSMNKETTKNAHKLLIEPAHIVFMRHIRATALYNGLGVFTDNFNRIYNLDVTKEQTKDQNNSEREAVVVLEPDAELDARIASSNSSRSKVLRQYLIEKFAGRTFTMSDGRSVIMDNTDAKELSQRAGEKKAAQLANLEKMIKEAIPVGEQSNVEHNKFDQFYYYAVTVKYGKEEIKLLLNVGVARNDGRNHLYAITDNKREAPTHYGVSGPVGHRIQSASLDSSVPQNSLGVKSNPKKSLGGYRTVRDALGHSDRFTQEMFRYFKELKQDVQGVSQKRSQERFYNDAVAFIRSHYATYQLGANPKVWATQLSSLIAAGNILDMTSIVKGVGISGKDVDEYCRLAWLRNRDDTAAQAQAVSSSANAVARGGKNALQKVRGVAMLPIGKFDRLVITRLFGACQVQIERNGGAKVGTKENKIEAGKLLQRVILETQQNSIATERSAAMRSGDELLRGFTMFSADAMKVGARFMDTYGELSVLRAMRKSAREKGDTKAEKELDKQIKRAKKQCVRSTSVLVGIAMYSAALALGFKLLYDQADEEDMGSFLADFFGNMLGGIPFVRDLYSFFFDGFEMDHFAISTVNDVLGGANDSLKLLEAACSGKEVSRTEALSVIRKMSYAAGQLSGVPVRNLYNAGVGLTRRFSSETGYAIDSMFYQKSYSADLKVAIEKGDDKMVATIAGLITDENFGGQSAVTRRAVRELVADGYHVLPRSVGDSVTYNGETVELTAAQQKKFRTIYDIADKSVDALTAMSQFAQSEAAVQAKAIRFLYDAYYELALSDTLGLDLATKNVLFAEAIDIEKLAIIVATARGMTADVDKNGNPISGSKKKKIVAYIESLRLSAAEKHMIFGYLGYSNNRGREKVEAHINRLSLSKEEKAALLSFSGYAA